MVRRLGGEGEHVTAFRTIARGDGAVRQIGGLIAREEVLARLGEWVAG